MYSDPLWVWQSGVRWLQVSSSASMICPQTLQRLKQFQCEQSLAKSHCVINLEMMLYLCACSDQHKSLWCTSQADATRDMQLPATLKRLTKECPLLLLTEFRGCFPTYFYIQGKETFLTQGHTPIKASFALTRSSKLATP